MKVALVWSACLVAGTFAADPSTMHLMDVTSGNCLQTGVTNAPGGLTLQPQCNIPNDNQVRLTCAAAVCSDLVCSIFSF